MTENNNFLFNFEKKIFVWEITFIVFKKNFQFFTTLSIHDSWDGKIHKNLRLPRDRFYEVLPR